MEVRVVLNRRLSGPYFLLKLESAELARKAKPGQFVRMKAWEGWDPFLPRPFSVHEVEGTRIGFLYQVKGPGTRLLNRVHGGQRIRIWGPYGRAFPFPEKGPVWLVAGGIGVAPFLFYAQTLRDRGLTFSVFYGARSREDLLRLSMLRRGSRLFMVATEDGSAGRRGLVTDILREGLAYESPEMIVACGPPAMLAAVGRWGEELGIPTYLSLEAFMACGLGLCLGCVVPRRTKGYIRVCVEGPAVDSREVDLEALV